ncbi:MAG: DNA modification methylase [Phycisphaerales bacterium]
MHIELRSVESIKPYEANPRKNDAAVGAVARSIREFGFRQPIVVDTDGVIVVGHTRWRAAGRLGLKEVPVHVARELTPEEARAYRIADNQTASIAEFDEELLHQELADLKALDFDLGTLGFDDDQLKELLAPRGTEGEVDPDDVPEPPETAVTQPGELIVLGAHKLLCGDSTKPGDVQKLMGDERAVLCASDPPYLVDYDGTSCGGITGKFESKRWDEYKDPAASVEFFESYLRCALDHAVTGNPAFYQWHASNRFPLVEQAWRNCGLLPHQTIVWTKESGVPGRCWFMQSHEPCIVGWIKGKLPERKPPPNAVTVWAIPRKSENLNVHPTQKPIEIFRRPLEWHTLPGQLVYEPFAGSGTQIIAAEQLGRRCYAIEQSPTFCDVIVTRWETFTGKKAERGA